MLRSSQRVSVACFPFQCEAKLLEVGIKKKTKRRRKRYANQGAAEDKLR